MAKHRKSQRKQHRQKKAEPVKREPEKNYSMAGWVAAFAVGLVLIGVLAYALMSEDEPAVQDDSYKGEQVAVDFYVMSKCPYGTQVQDAIAPVLSRLGDAVDFGIDYIANDNGDGTFRSLHGQTEVEGNIVQLCAAKYHPESYMDMIVCQNQNMAQIPGNWESCAQAAGFDTEKIRECYESDEGKQLHSASVAKSTAAGATGSPTIYIDGARYSGGRSENDFLRAICSSFETERPDACAEIPPPTKVNAMLLNDKRCAECDTTSLVGQLKGLFPGLSLKEYDYGSAEGKKLYEDSGLKALPAVLFDESVEAAEGYSSVQRYLEPAGAYTSLRIGAQFDPAAEICTNGMDDTGNGLVDCSDPTCESTLECRPEKDGHLTVFTMSDCPYGRLAVKALKEVADNFPDMDYEVHYIASETASGFSSLHGQYEVDEDIIQLCVKEHSPAVWFDYIYCRSDKGVKGIDWKGCAADVGVDIESVQECFDSEEGAQLLREDILIADSLGISASPTWLANNRYKFSGLDAQTVKTQYCTYNPGEGCDATLSGGSVPSGSC